MKRLYTFLAVLMMVFGCFISQASAVSFFDIFFDITYTPPTGSEFGFDGVDGDLGGQIDVFNIISPGNLGSPLDDFIIIQPQLVGSLNFSGLMAGETVRLGIEGLAIVDMNDCGLFSFNGSISGVGPSPLHNAYAFPIGTTSVDTDPGAGQRFDIGPDSPPDSIFPIFAFSSPGTEVGSIQVHVNAVPEPSTLLLIGSGLAGLVALRKKLGRRHG